MKRSRAVQTEGRAQVIMVRGVEAGSGKFEGIPRSAMQRSAVSGRSSSSSSSSSSSCSGSDNSKRCPRLQVAGCGLRWRVLLWDLRGGIRLRWMRRHSVRAGRVDW